MCVCACVQICMFANVSACICTCVHMCMSEIDIYDLNVSSNPSFIVINSLSIRENI